LADRVHVYVVVGQYLDCSPIHVLTGPPPIGQECVAGPTLIPSSWMPCQIDYTMEYDTYSLKVIAVRLIHIYIVNLYYVFINITLIYISMLWVGLSIPYWRI